MTKTQSSILAVVILTSFLGPFLISSVSIALPAIEADFKINAVTLSWIITSFLLSSAISLLPLGRIADIHGNKTIFKTGTLIFTLFSFGCALASTPSLLISLRFLQGIGAAMVMTTGPAILVLDFPVNIRGKIIGMTVAAVYIGLSVGPFCGGLITNYWNWRGIFYLTGILGSITTAVSFYYLKQTPNTKQAEKMDYFGSFLYAGALIALVFGSSSIKEISGLQLVMAGAVLLFLFWFQQKKSAKALLPIQLLTNNKLFTFSNLAALINYSATFAIVFLLSLYLQNVKGFSPHEAGSILIAQPIMMALFSPYAGSLSDRYEPRVIASAGVIICTVGLALFTLLEQETSTFIIILNLSFIGLGFAFFSSPNMNTIMSSVSKDHAGIAGGMAATMRLLGQMASMAIASIFFALFMANQSVEEVDDKLFLEILRYCFMVFALICSSGIYFSLKRGKLFQC